MMTAAASTREDLTYEALLRLEFGRALPVAARDADQDTIFSMKWPAPINMPPRPICHPGDCTRSSGRGWIEVLRRVGTESRNVCR